MMDEKICYFQHKIIPKLQKNVSQSLTYKISNNIPKIKLNKYTVEIPSTGNSKEGFQRYYSLKVIDKNTLENLEEDKVINTDPNLAKLFPVITPADGNCLCHAVSMYLWSIPDREYFLRRLIYITMVSDEKKLLQRLYMQHVANEKLPEENFISDIWIRQWESLVVQTQDVPVNPGSTQLEPLEAIHVFILANILHRPIIVLSSPVVRTVFEQTIQKNNINGIYLPLLCNSNETEKSPIVLSFFMNHFTPLMYMENSTQKKSVLLKQIPLETLPVHFCQDSLTNCISKKIKAYLNIDKKTKSILIQPISLPKDQNLFCEHSEHHKALYDNMTKPVAGKATNQKDTGLIKNLRWNEEFMERHSDTIHIISSFEHKDPSLCINNCGMYGSIELGNRCSKCFAQQSTLSAITLKKKPEQNHKPNEEYVPKKNSVECFLQSNTEHFAPVREYHNLPQKISPQTSTQDLIKEQSQAFLHPQIFFSSNLLEDETELIPIKQQVHPQFKDMTSGVVTCITSGCFEKAHRKLDYRCAVCYVNKPKMNEAAIQPVQQKNSIRTIDSFSQFSEKLPEKSLKNKLTAACSEGMNAVDKTQNATLFTNLRSEDTQVSLLELLCSNDNCPNRRVSLLHSLCSSCIESKSNFCLTPGCNNECDVQKSHGMCKNCYRQNQQKIQTTSNTTQQILTSEHFPINNGQKKCDKPHCINSGGIHCTGFCIKCYIAIDNQEYTQPSAPTFHN